MAYDIRCFSTSAAWVSLWKWAGQPRYFNETALHGTLGTKGIVLTTTIQENTMDLLVWQNSWEKKSTLTDSRLEQILPSVDMSKVGVAVSDNYLCPQTKFPEEEPVANGVAWARAQTFVLLP